MGNVVNITPKRKSPGINLSKWKSAHGIASVLMVRLKQIRLLKRLIRQQDKQLAANADIIRIQKDLIDALKDRMKLIEAMVQ